MQESKLSHLLWAISSSITISLIVFTYTGKGLGIEYGLTSLIALIGWLKFSYKETPTQNLIAPIYLAVIVLLMLLFTSRFYSDFPAFLQNNYSAFFKADFNLNIRNWFLTMVCLPICILLLGGYFLTKRLSLGFFFAWWGLAFSVIESIFQFKAELTSAHNYPSFYYTGLIVSSVLFVWAIRGILLLIKPSYNHSESFDYTPLTPKQINLWTILFLASVVVYAVTLYSQAGPLPVGVIVGSMMGGLMGWRKTTAIVPANPYKYVPLYLLLQTFFYIHVGEEALTDFGSSISKISGKPWSEHDFYALIVFIGPVFWFFTAYSLWKKQPIGNFLFWFMIVGMILGEPTHLLVFPFVKMYKFGGDYEYFSGMYTALFPMIPAIIALISILKEKKERENAKSIS